MVVILIIDNYDSFTHNLYQLAGEILRDDGMDEEIMVLRNDEARISDLRALDPEKIIISPGPGNPSRRSDFGVCMDVIGEFRDRPLLGVCLGHQGIFHAFGGRVDQGEPVHGKIVEVFHDGSELFRDVPNPFRATRYHSLICRPEDTPADIEVTAVTSDEIIMAIKHREYPVYGLQFHPESAGTPSGRTVIRNFLRM
ncbi:MULTISPECIES: anthranilate synthase component II [unclassified Methanothermobacter]|jgi:anthranilate synthase component 2|uniref:anthranilate synthase component II n=1 Tax=unclassified Methanothermobacter TaxID=2631116 RepID=UPI00064E2AD6|nr:MULTISPECIES: aminodeoxychorismate/anthranilate synthase component II [unclassified Methanothermobacter]MDN5374210.1 anthranilate synthase component [Methanothermobacter sp.]BAZ99650.1 Anthranilate synthase component 2 [Methanothermobacter sp. EMTCatA1]